MKKNLTPQICPIKNHFSFRCDPKECPKDYRWCSKFSGWFWYKASQNKEPITEDKIPQALIQEIYGRGKRDAEERIESEMHDFCHHLLHFIERKFELQPELSDLDSKELVRIAFNECIQYRVEREYFLPSWAELKQ